MRREDFKIYRIIRLLSAQIISPPTVGLGNFAVAVVPKVQVDANTMYGTVPVGHLQLTPV